MGPGRGAERSAREREEVRRRARSGVLREQGVLGECGTMTRACRETPGGAGGVANDDPALGVQRGGAHFGLAESPGRVREGGAPPERRVSGAGVRGRQPPANGSPSTKARRADCAGYLVSRQEGHP